MTKRRDRRRTATGTVDRGPRDKTLSVKSVRLVRHPRYHRYVRRVTVCKVHDEREEARPGDTVEMMETRPLSKTKHWRLSKILTRRADKGSEVQS